MAEENELQDSPKPAGEEEIPSKPTGEGEPEKTPEESDASPEDQVAQLKKTNQQLYERAKRAETELKTNKEETAQKEPPKTQEKDPIKEAKDYARLYAQGYSDEEVALLEKYKGEKSITEVAKELNLIIEDMREKKKSEQQVPPPSTEAGATEKEKDTSKMTSTERADTFEDLILKRRKAQGI